MSLHNRQWNSILSMLNELDIKKLTKQEFYAAISKWLVSNKNAFKEQLWTSYGLDKLSSLDPSLFNVESSEGSIEENISRLNNLQPSSQDSIVVIIRDILWDMAAFKTDIRCPNCKDDDLRALLDPDTESIILSCDLCCWSQSNSGTQKLECQNLIPANKLQLIG